MAPQAPFTEPHNRKPRRRQGLLFLTVNSLLAWLTECYRENPAARREWWGTLCSYCNLASFAFAFSTIELEGYVLTSLLYASLAAALSPSAR